MVRTLSSAFSLRTPVLLFGTVLLLYWFWDQLSDSQIRVAARLRSSSLSRTRTYQNRRDPPVLGCPANTSQNLAGVSLTGERKQKAAILLLARDGDLEALVPTLHNFEETFNGKFRYPYVFLNEVPYSAEFTRGVRDALPRGAEVKFGVIPQEHWSIPDWLDKKAVREGLEEMERQGIQYAGRESYHHMCRYYSGLFALHPLLQEYDFYWRLEPGVRFYCDLQYDPFHFMAVNNKVYGWVITIVETPNTIPTLFETMLNWRAEVVKNNTAGRQLGRKLKLAEWEKKGELWDFFLENTERDKRGRLEKEEKYNLCHFWTNFEIGDLRFFRSPEYRSLFDYLDRSGKFYTERWGDAPIRSLTMGLLAGFDRVHFFEDIAYLHDWFMHKSSDPSIGCNCEAPAFDDAHRDIDNDGWYSCLPRWRALDQR